MDRRLARVVKLHIIMWKFSPVRVALQPIMEFSINCIIRIQAPVQASQFRTKISIRLRALSSKHLVQVGIGAEVIITTTLNSTTAVTLITSSSLTAAIQKKPKAASISRIFPMSTTHLKNRPVYPQTLRLQAGMITSFAKARHMTSTARRCPHRTLRSTQSGRRRLLKLRFT